MTDGEEDPPDADEGTVLSPDELDITDDERVFELDEGRYVISAGEDRPDIHRVIDNEEAERDEPAPAEDVDASELDEAVVHRWIHEYVADSGSQYGFDITAKFEGSIARHELFSNDVVTTFETLLGWYATQLGGDTPLEDVLGILLMEANVEIRYPAASLSSSLRAVDIGPDDTVAELLESVEAAGGLRIRSASSGGRESPDE